MKEPTKEQIKEFWEWCGFRYVKQEIVVKNIIMPYGSHWVDPSGKPLADGTMLLPIDLNNLFKYAVEKLFDELSNRGESYKMQRLWLALKDSFLESNQYYRNHALALFWAIYELIHEASTSSN